MMPAAGAPPAATTFAAIARVRRAAGRSERRDGPLQIERRPLAALASITAEWDALASAALEPNIFHAPSFALAAAPLFGAEVEAMLVWSHEPQRRLAGLFPVRVARCRYGLPIGLLSLWTHPFAPLGTPLVHRELAAAAIGAWLDHLIAAQGLPRVLLLPLLTETGPFAAALDVAVTQRGLAGTWLGRHRRALLAPGDGRGDYLRRKLAPKRRKELARQWRRLQELGSVAVDHRHGPDVRAALGDFLRLEASGWKGRAGTAAISDGRVRDFMIHAVVGLAARDEAVVHRLLLQDRAIAAAITLRSGASGWCWKIAYDERYARFSPGAQLLYRVTEALLAEPLIAQVDSLAVPDHPLIDRLWGERLAMADRLIGLEPGVRYPLMRGLESVRRFAVTSLRRLLRRR